MHCCSVVAVKQSSYAVHIMQCGRCELATGLMCICICVFIFVFLCICICVFMCLYFAVVLQWISLLMQCMQGLVGVSRKLVLCVCFLFVFLCTCNCVFVFCTVDQSSYAVHARFGRCEQETGPRACLRRRLVVGSDNGKVRNPRGST